MSAIQTAVVGGGAAGLMAAISAAESGRSVTLFEGNQRPGRKILISGNGRCNLTNREADSLGHYHGTHPEFIGAVLRRFRVEDTVSFFGDMGLECKTGSLGRLFPVTDQASSVLALLEDRLAVVGVRGVTGAKITRIGTDGYDFELATATGRAWHAHRVVLATGGVSMPKLGADASGMALASSLGHVRTPLHPGLVPLCGGDRHIHAMQGAKVHGALSVSVPNGRTHTEEGDVLFTKYGISGLAVLNLSARIVQYLDKNDLEVTVNLFPGRSPEEVSMDLRERWARNGHQRVALSLAAMIPDRIAHAVLALLQIASETPVSKLSKARRWALAKAVTGLAVTIHAPRPFEFAEVTIGGIEAQDVDAETLESHLVPGLYLAGEMLNVHGDLGGFNFQWAWSSGHLAGLGSGRQ